MHIPVTSFADYVGNQQAIALVKKAFKSHAVTVVVGKPAGGRTCFVECMKEHFRGQFRFVSVSPDDGIEALKHEVTFVEKRKAGPMERFMNMSLSDTDLPLRIVLDDFDNAERNFGAFIESCAATMRPGNGFLLVTDGVGLRKLSHLKKKGCLIVALTPPGREAVLKWARRTFLGDLPEEEDIMLVKRLVKATNNSIPSMAKSLAWGKPLRQAVLEAESADDAVHDFDLAQDNVSMMHTLFVKGATCEQLLRMIAMDGGSMIGQLLWHNVPTCGISNGAYISALERAVGGMVLERAGHVRHDRDLRFVGHMLSIAPFCGASKGQRLDKSSLCYTSTMAEGGARAVARKSLTKIDDRLSVCERAYQKK